MQHAKEQHANEQQADMPCRPWRSFMLSVRVRVTAPDAKAALAMIKGRARAHDRMACTMEDPLSVWGPPVDLIDGSLLITSCLSPALRTGWLHVSQLGSFSPLRLNWQWASYDEDDACWAHLDYASD